MITDSFKNWHLYTALLPGKLKAIFDFIKTVSAETENKRYDISGIDIYALVQQYTSRPLSEGKIEAHRRYADIQAVIRGKEIIGISKLNSLKEISPYEQEKDFALFENTAEKTSLMKLDAEDFMILFPEDGHMPGIAVDGEISEVKKVVVKVRYELFLPVQGRH